jgi:hypothetical protein
MQSQANALTQNANTATQRAGTYQQQTDNYNTAQQINALLGGLENRAMTWSPNEIPQYDPIIQLLSDALNIDSAPMAEPAALSPDEEAANAEIMQGPMSPEEKQRALMAAYEYLMYLTNQKVEGSGIGDPDLQSALPGQSF